MYHFEFHKKSKSIITLGYKKYPWLFGLGLSDESIEVRYYLLEYLSGAYGYSGKLEKDPHGKSIPIPIAGGFIFWSVSHSNNYTAFSISNMVTGIDISEQEERDMSLLDNHPDSEYHCLGDKNWKNFYILWTAKESIIKVAGGKLDDMNRIHFLERDEDGNLIFIFHTKVYKVHSFFEDVVIISYVV